MHIINHLLELIFPARCIKCAAYGSFICTDCLSKIPPAPENRHANAMWSYRDATARRLVTAFKYAGKTSLANTIAQPFYDFLLAECEEKMLYDTHNDLPLMIPIPVSRRKQRKRGFNQTQLLVKALADIDQGANFKPAPDILIKIKDTPDQASLSHRNDRMKNMRGVFAVNPRKHNEITGKAVILIDDVTTTGATINEAKRVLLGAGARKIIACTVAH